MHFQEPPEDLKAAVAESVRLGRIVYEADKAAADASDNIQRLGDNDEWSSQALKRLKGWLSLRRDDGTWDVLFYGMKDGEPEYLFRTRSAERQPNGSPPDIPAEITPEMRAMIRARQTAASQARVVCATGTNPVVLPASLIGREGWLVYMLQSSHRRGEIVVGGHRRFIISPNGDQIVEDRALSKGCLVSQTNDHTDAIITERWTSDVPTEADVFTSLNSRMDMYVRTRRGAWKVEGPKVSWCAMPPPHLRPDDPEQAANLEAK